MKTSIYILTIFSLVLFSGCGAKFSGKSEKEFKASKLIVENKLDTIEKVNLEKALRVIVMYAMQVKWDEAEKYKGESFNNISLDIVDNKTYNGVIDFAEDYLEKENEIKAGELKKEITKLEEEKKEASKTIEMLALLKTTDIRIIKEEYIGEYVPLLKVTLTNTSNFDLIDGYEIDVNAFSISKKIKLNVDGSGLRKGYNPQKGGIIIEKNTLKPLMRLSKTLSSKLKNATYPITDLTPFDLEVSAEAVSITTSDGKLYEYPEKDLIYFDNEIKKLKKELEIIESLEGKLSEIELTDTNSNSNAVFNEKYIDEINSIREKSSANKLEEQLVKIDKNLSLKFPKAYHVLKQKFYGTSSIRLADSLTFNSQDENLIQFQIQDTIYKEYISKYDKAHGQFRALYKPTINYAIKDDIEEWKTSINTLVEADDSGYITLRADTYDLTRYFKIKGTHYLYSMDFKSLEECIVEFDRSKNMGKQ